ncbi:hypothetical protein BsWGS_22468 [Bradybaena similaris]
MYNNLRFDGQWLYLHTDKCRLPPILGSYHIAQFQQRRPRLDADLLDFKRRDVFTSRVCSPRLPLVGVPDIDWLRRKGHCLPTETELLKSQRNLPTDRTCRPRVTVKQRPLQMPKIRTPQAPRILTTHPGTQAGNLILPPIVPTSSVWASKSPVTKGPAKMGYSAFVSQHEQQRKIATQRRLAQATMKTKTFQYRTRLNRALSHDEGIMRRFASGALDDEHKEILARLVQDSEGSQDGSTKSSTFQDWKKSVMSVLDQQGEDDLRMVASFRRIIKRKPVLRKRKMTGILSQTDMTNKADTKSDTMFPYEMQTPPVPNYPEEKKLHFLGVEDPGSDRPHSAVSNRSSATSLASYFD